ncbi:DNA mismatch repair protein Msh6 [Anaeromyces robustus]|uniref:DNA mismatch repair protein n=1 Tax=Anaeromyces robustus TaxID=1754192 RepID=A0A1Y1WUE1_9FUNG|nr:DNA mismatch repair protein Msh6 [Anaeromyces robustus]|eukprot:ORX76754.1 DNA mismatch repair protein Msh6 [Anaeromyces robustus]
MDTDSEEEMPIMYKKKKIKITIEKETIQKSNNNIKEEEENNEEPPKRELRHLRRGTQMKRKINYKESDSEGSDNDDSDEYVPKNEESDDDDDNDEGVKEEEPETESESEDDTIYDDEIKRKPKNNKKFNLNKFNNSSPSQSPSIKSNSSSYKSPIEKLSAFRSPKMPNKFGLSTQQEKRKEKEEKFKEKNEDRYSWLMDVRDENGRRPGEEDYDPRTLYIPSSAWKKFTPFERQYWEIKSKHWEKVVFFKKGKFYELYEKDADIGHQEFDLKMTDRVNMRMVGVPEASFEQWASQFVAKGYKVAKVDQMETALKKSMNARNSKSKEEKVIKRELSQVLTAGTLVDSGFLTNDMSAYCMSIKEELQPINGVSESYLVTEDRSPPKFGVCIVDTTTATFKFSSFIDDIDRTRFETLLIQYKPKEIVIERGGLSQRTVQMLKRIVGNKNQWNILIPEKEFWGPEKTELELKIQNYFDESKKNKKGNEENEDIEMNMNNNENENENENKMDIDIDTENRNIPTNWPEVLKQAINDPVLLSAIGGLLWYLQSLKIDRELFSLKNFSFYDPVNDASSLILDGQTLMNLEVFQNNNDGSTEGTLFELLEHCTTPFGKRQFRNWVCHPLRNIEGIEDRLNASDDMLNIYVEENNSSLVDYIDTILRKLPDLERIISRIHAGSCQVKEFIKSLKAFTIIMELFINVLNSQVEQLTSKRLKEIAQFGFFEVLKEELIWFQNAFDWEKATKENKITPIDGYDETYDETKQAIKDIEQELQDYLRKIQKRLGSKEIVYKDLGKEIYQIQVPKRLVKSVPKDWIQMSKTQAVNRYYNSNLRNDIQRLNEAKELFNDAEGEVKLRIYQRFDIHYDKWLKVIKLVAEVDCLACLARCREVLGEPSCRPEFVNPLNNEMEENSVLELTELRHPCVNVGVTQDFIPNDTYLGGVYNEDEIENDTMDTDNNNTTITTNNNNKKERPKLILLTGPNMGGKSTLLRQTCIAVIMAQIGCYVPARKCRLTPFDRIFTRIGANDNILAGQSTFMIELAETSKILKEATPRSLVILDELGRGTSTFDGFSIAYSVLNYIITQIRCIGLFSTHYGMLTEEYKNNPLVACKFMSFHSDEENHEVVFLYKLTDGVCPKSYGMNVANIAGVPKSIVLQAEEVAAEFEKNSKIDDTELTTTKDLTMIQQSAFAYLFNSKKSNSNTTISSNMAKTIKALYCSLQK